MSRISLLRPLRLLITATALCAMGGLSLVSPIAANASGNTVYSLTVHYYRFDNTYTNWNLWGWANTGANTSDCTPSGTLTSEGAFPLTGTDSFGEYGTIAFSCPAGSNVTQFGLIVRQVGWVNREPPGNRYITLSSGTSVSDWVVSGDPTDYSSLAAANLAKYTYIKTAKFSGKHTVDTTLTKAFKLTVAGQGWVLKDLTKKKTYKATASSDGLKYPGLDAVVAGSFQSLDGNPKDKSGWNPASTTTKMKQVSGDLYQYSITLPAGSYTYKIALGGAWTCGTCASYPGNNVSLELDGSEEVTFYFVPYGDQVFDSINNPTAALPPSTAGFQTTAVNLTFKKATLSTKDTYVLHGPGVPAVTIKKGKYTLAK